MLVSPVSPIARPRERPLVNLSMQQKSVMLRLPGVYDAIFLPIKTTSTKRPEITMDVAGPRYNFPKRRE